MSLEESSLVPPSPPTPPLLLVVGSTNPVKIASASAGIKQALRTDNIRVVGFNVPSGVSDQPFSDEETKSGARNRAKNAWDAYISAAAEAPSSSSTSSSSLTSSPSIEESKQPPTFSLGMEGGVQLVGGDLECFAWICIYNGSDFSLARTGSFFLPPEIKRLVIDEKMELGHADDKVFGSINSKQAGGAVGALTKGVIDRSAYYTHAVILAFVKFNWPELYNK